MDTGTGIWEYRAFGQQELTSLHILRPEGSVFDWKTRSFLGNFDKGLVGIKPKVHEGDRSPSAEIQTAGGLPINTQIYERITDFKSIIEITVAYLYSFSISAFRLAKACNLRKRV
jgi:hypothetical protein